MGNEHRSQDFLLSTRLALADGLFVMFVLLAKAYCRQSNAMPLASTCGAAISATCHPPEQCTDLFHLPVELGVIGPKSETPIGCFFTTLRKCQDLHWGELIFSLFDADGADLGNAFIRSWQRLRKLGKGGRRQHEI